MFVEAIINENIDGEYTYLEKGELISGFVRSYEQDFMNIDEVIDIDCDYNENGDIIDTNYVIKKTRLKIKKGSIKRVYCGCGNNATREISSEYLCDECEYEEGEDFTYLSQTPWESD